MDNLAKAQMECTGPYIHSPPIPWAPTQRTKLALQLIYETWDKSDPKTQGMGFREYWVNMWTHLYKVGTHPFKEHGVPEYQDAPEGGCLLFTGVLNSEKALVTMYQDTHTEYKRDTDWYVLCEPEDADTGFANRCYGVVGPASEYGWWSGELSREFNPKTMTRQKSWDVERLLREIKSLYFITKQRSAGGLRVFKNRQVQLFAWWIARTMWKTFSVNIQGFHKKYPEIHYLPCYNRNKFMSIVFHMITNPEWWVSNHKRCTPWFRHTGVVYSKYHWEKLDPVTHDSKEEGFRIMRQLETEFGIKLGPNFYLDVVHQSEIRTRAGDYGDWGYALKQKRDRLRLRKRKDGARLIRMMLGPDDWNASGGTEHRGIQILGFKKPE